MNTQDIFEQVPYNKGSDKIVNVIESRRNESGVIDEDSPRHRSESIVTDLTTYSTSRYSGSGTSAATIVLGRDSPDIDDADLLESRRSSGYEYSQSESRPSSTYDTNQSESRPSSTFDTNQSESRRSSVYDPNQSESRRSSFYDPNQSESHRSSFFGPNQSESRRSSVYDSNQSDSRRSSFYDPNQSESRRSSFYDPNQSESRRSSIHGYSQEEFESLSGSQSQRSAVLRFSRHFTDSDHRETYTDDFDSLDESDTSDVNNKSESGSRNELDQKGRDVRHSRSQSLLTSGDDLYDYDEEDFESCDDSISLKSDALNKKSAQQSRFQSDVLESRSAGSVADSPRMYGPDEKPPLSARTIPSSEDQLRLETERVLRAFVRVKLRAARHNKASKLSSFSRQRDFINSSSTAPTHVDAKDSHSLRMFCRLKRDQLKNDNNPDTSGNDNVRSGLIGGTSVQHTNVPDAFMKKARLNQILSRLHEIDFHEPRKCRDCRRELEQNALLDFAAQKKAVALEKLVNYRLENIVAQNGLTSFGDFLVDMSALQKDRDLVFDKLMRPLHRQTVVSDLGQ